MYCGLYFFFSIFLLFNSLVKRGVFVVSCVNFTVPRSINSKVSGEIIPFKIYLLFSNGKRSIKINKVKSSLL